jgi:LuxR family maltose regulon positive regulatory protein
MDELPFVEAKLAPLTLPENVVERPRLATALDQGRGRSLTLVSAPPGYGKTTALRAWCDARATPVAWVTLDAADNDPTRLWAYLASAVDRVREGVGRVALQRLKTLGASVEPAIDELANGIAAYGGELTLVLDDLETVRNVDGLASLDHFVERFPRKARLVFVTRKDPPLRLAHLRARGDLAELRDRDLAFTRPEAHELLVDRAGLDLSPPDVARLLDRTEGWPAALALAAGWLRRVGDPARAARVFGGDQPFVAEYLRSEVLTGLTDDVRSFLLRAGVLGRFTADLCDAVLGRTDSARMVVDLDHSNLFVIRLEQPGWFRIHSLLADFAALEVTSADPGAVVEIHRRAAEWLRSQGRPVEAADHAAAAGDEDLLAEVLAEHHVDLIRGGGAPTLLRWVRTLPDEQLFAHPDLAVSGATAAAVVGRSSLVRRRLLRLANRARIERPEGFTPYVEALADMLRAASLEGGVGDAVEAGRRAVRIAEAAADDVVVAALGAYARALYFAGELDGAWDAALRAIEHEEAERRFAGHAFACATLALVAVERGRVGSARTHAEKAKTIVAEMGSTRTWLGANAAAALGAVLAAGGDLAAAERELAHAEHFFRDEVASVHHAWLLVLLARVRCRRGRLENAAAAARAAREALGELGDSGSVPAFAAEVEREIEQARTRAADREVLDLPSEAELSLLRLLATDLTAPKIAEELYLSPNTVRSHARAIYRKLGVGSRADAVARADALGLLRKEGSPR